MHGDQGTRVLEHGILGMVHGKPLRPEEVEAKCAGNLDFIVEKRNDKLSVVDLRQL